MLKRSPLSLSFAALASLTALTTAAQAYEAGDVILRAGPALVAPDASNGTSLAGLDVDNNTQLGLTASWMLTPNIGVELLAATPFKHTITQSGADIGSTRQLPPTVSLQWFPLSNAIVQPYMGVGLNYTFFYDTKNTLGVDLDLDSSVGLAVQAGVDVRISDKLIVNAAVWKVDINTDVSVNGASVGELEIDPFAAMVGVGYRF